MTHRPHAIRPIPPAGRDAPRRWAAAAVALALVAPPAAAQEEADALLEAGAELYQSHCSACHRPDGTGIPPDFPALDGNAALEDVGLIVARVRDGQGAMPPFPQLDAEAVAAVASHVRTAWQNDFGAVETEAVVAALAALEEADGTTDEPEIATIWDGVYTEAQAERGAPVYQSACALCHGRRLDGAAADPDQRPSPPLARARFLRVWEGNSLGSLYGYTRATMPQQNPGQLSDEQYVDVIAYMLQASDAPPGETELTPDLAALGSIVIEPPPE
jgi:mono/diheme cytochrome c family protein